MDIRIFDGCFAHIPYSLDGRDEPKNIKWQRGGPYRDITVYTDHYLPTAHLDQNDSRIQIAWLIEPSVINTRGYEAVKKHHRYYDYILSHDRPFLAQFPKEKQVWVVSSSSFLYSPEWKLYPKSKLVLSVIGEKRRAIGHKLRYEMAAKLGHKMDIMGRGFKPFPVEKRAETFAPYMYQVVIHNTNVPDYWSGILIDCFATGTVPIVWGGSFLHKYFDMRGIILFDTLDQLEEILNEINERDYYSRATAIRDNFTMAFHMYRVTEDYMYDSFFKTLEK